MPYRKDPLYISATWGRIGAALLLLVATALQAAGYTFSLEAQEELFNAISTILGAGALILVTVSKVRESKKLNE